MELHLEGKTALVSGSTAGIGFAIVKELAREGTTVYVNGRTEERVQEAIQQVKREQPDAKAEGIAADLATAEGADLLFRSLPAVDILINNLGIFEPKRFEDITDDDWRRFFDVIVLSGFRLSRLYLA